MMLMMWCVKVDPTTGVYIPYSFANSGFFYVPQEPDKRKCCETGPVVFRPYPTSHSADQRSPNWANQVAVEGPSFPFSKFYDGV